MELEIEEDIEASFPEASDYGAAGCEVKFKSYFEPLALAFELVNLLKGQVGGGEVQGYDEAVAGGIRRRH